MLKAIAGTVIGGVAVWWLTTRILPGRNSNNNGVFMTPGQEAKGEYYA